ncbi:hypothetical protein M405DRAFT_593583 [Rhizopogon salebrosus TDB-379]|nr:hypothetical protein M405DRAFT_593583 [Rhizopogon salebrosus TDB-379]
MACHVYRAVYLGTIRPTASTTSRSFLTPMEPRVLSRARYEYGIRRAIRPQSYDDSGSTPIHITIATESFREDTGGKRIHACLTKTEEKWTL